MQFFHTQFHNGSIISNDDINNNNLSLSRQLSIIDDGPLRIHIGNIPFSWSDKHLREQFDIFGPVDDVEVVSNAQGSKGFGFLTFLRRRDGERAMQVKNGTIADGRKITVSLAVAKNHPTSSSLTTPPETPARTAFRSLSTNRPLPLLATSSSLSPDAPMWTPLTPPSSTTWRLSPEPQSNGWINTSPPLSSSPLSILFPPLFPPARVERSVESENVNNHLKSVTTESITYDKNSCKHCPHCGRTIY
ncbi:unnamed protein product [Adineta steineri]|uniref:RRM domain-containing protein n=1 Tax=Adineta steineri TaxID=433720 RepID=A0A814YXN7_9BILA|nr:unnamed protein product [Adineta steineri]CAF1234628.1 unnamed protein product [Adineta steineri]CAF1298024.1 unnamed protein product [Adineta steineri]CAF3508030.1 unnamed protein product [Adineta steineri]CAF3653512.1 unnamed protein product [Adineta steineri]